MYLADSPTPLFYVLGFKQEAKKAKLAITSTQLHSFVRPSKYNQVALLFLFIFHNESPSKLPQRQMSCRVFDLSSMQ